MLAPLVCKRQRTVGRKHTAQVNRLQTSIKKSRSTKRYDLQQQYSPHFRWALSGQQFAQESAGGSRNLQEQAGPARPGRSENSDSRAAANPAAAGERVEAQQSAQLRGNAALIPLKTAFTFKLLSNFTERKGWIRY